MCCSLFVVRCGLFVVFCAFFLVVGARRVVFVEFRLLVVDYVFGCFSFVCSCCVCRDLFVVRWLLCVVCCGCSSMVGGWCLLGLIRDLPCVVC